MTENFVLLVYSRNTPYSYDAHTPLSILALGAYLETKGVEVEYFDERVEGRRCFDELIARRPRLAGFSVIGGYQIASAARLSRRVRRASPETRIVWGGIAPTTLPGETLREDYVDYAVIGEGEASLLELFKALRGGGSPDRVPGVADAPGGRIRRGPARAPLDVESLPFVYQKKAAGMLKRYLGVRALRETVGYEASRGCPFGCRFCYSPNFHHQARVKSVGKVAAELAQLRRLGADDLDIYDDTLFGGERGRFPAFIDILKREGFSWIGNLRINMLTPELLRRLESSGCKWLYFGIESDDDKTLEAIEKGITAREIHEGIRLMRSSKIPAVYSIIYGLPLKGEKEKIGRYLDFAEEIHRRHPAAEIQVQSFVPLPGTELYEHAIRFGFKPPRRLADWIDHDHFGVTNPWLDDPGLANKIYISSFLAFRYRRHLSHFPICLLAYPLHRISLRRIRRRCFGFYFEGGLYRLALAVGRALTGAYFLVQDLLLYPRGPARRASPRRSVPTDSGKV